MPAFNDLKFEKVCIETSLSLSGLKILKSSQLMSTSEAFCIFPTIVVTSRFQFSKSSIDLFSFLISSTLGNLRLISVHASYRYRLTLYPILLDTFENKLIRKLVLRNLKNWFMIASSRSSNSVFCFVLDRLNIRCCPVFYLFPTSCPLTTLVVVLLMTISLWVLFWPGIAAPFFLATIMSSKLKSNFPNKGFGFSCSFSSTTNS